MSATTNDTTSSLPLTSLRSIILSTGPFLFLWSYLRQYVSKYGPLRPFTTITPLNSQLYALFSAFLAYLLIQTYLSPDQPATLPFNIAIPFVDKSTFTISDLGLVYHYSKFYEYVDVINLVAQGKVIGQHMAFHHITTPYLTYFRVLNAGNDWRVFALANCVHHALMYSYFGGLGNWLRSVLLVTGWVQLGLGLGTDGLWMWRTNGGKKLESSNLEGSARRETTFGKDEVTNRGIAILLLARYAMLFAQEIRQGRAGMKKEDRERERVKVGAEEQREKKRK